MTATQRAHDELRDLLHETGSEARIVQIDLGAAAVMLRGDYADILLARRACERLGLRIVQATTWP